MKKIRILGTKVIPVWLLVLALVVTGAGAAAGTILAGKVTGEVPVAVSQALLVERPVLANDLMTLDYGGTNGQASLTTDQPRTGDYSVKLHTESGDDWATVWFPVNIPLSGITSLSFYYKQPVSTANPYFLLAIDTDGDGVWDDTGTDWTGIDLTPPTNVSAWTQGSGDDLQLGSFGLGSAAATWTLTEVLPAAVGGVNVWYPGWPIHEGATWLDVPPPGDYGDLQLADWQAGAVSGADWGHVGVNTVGGSLNLSTKRVVAIGVSLSGYSGDQTAYIDDLKVNGLVYPMDPGDLIGVAGVPQGTQRHYATPNRYIGTVSDDNTAFQFASEVATGDMYLIALPLKNASNNNLVAELTLNVPGCMEVEVMSASDVHGGGNVINAIRIGLNTWKFKVLGTAEYNWLTDNLYIAVSLDDGCAPGYYNISGTIKQIGY